MPENRVHQIIAVGGTGQMVLHFYAQLFLTGSLGTPFRALVVDTDRLSVSLEYLKRFLDHVPRPTIFLDTDLKEGESECPTASKPEWPSGAPEVMKIGVGCGTLSDGVAADEVDTALEQLSP